MLNQDALLLYAFLHYVKEKDIKKPALNIINDSQPLSEFVNELNKYASIQAGLEQVDYVPIQQSDVQQVLIKMFNKEMR